MLLQPCSTRSALAYQRKSVPANASIRASLYGFRCMHSGNNAQCGCSRAAAPDALTIQRSHSSPKAACRSAPSRGSTLTRTRQAQPAHCTQNKSHAAPPRAPLVAPRRA